MVPSPSRDAHRRSDTLASDDTPRLVVCRRSLAAGARVPARARRQFRGDYAPLTDAKSFDHIAASLVAGHGFGEAQLAPATGPTAYRAPLYPLSLGAVYKVFGVHKYTFGLLTQAIIGVGVATLIGLIAAQLWGRRVAAIVLLIAAVHPTMMLFGSSLQLEPLLELLTLGTLAAALSRVAAVTGCRGRWPLACSSGSAS